MRVTGESRAPVFFRQLALVLQENETVEEINASFFRTSAILAEPKAAA